MKTKPHLLSLGTKLILLMMTIPMFGRAQRVKFGQTFPQTNSAFEISVVHDNLSRMLMPVGAYRVSHTSYIFWSVKKNTAMFGVLGVLVDDQVSRSATKNKVAEKEMFRKADLDSITTHLIKVRLQSQKEYAFGDNTSEYNNIKVSPRSWVFINGNNYEMAFELEARYFNESGVEKWKARYTYIVPDPTPLSGEESLLENNGELLVQLAQRGINKCIEVLFEDLKGSSAQWKNDGNIPKDLDEYAEGTLFLKLPEKCILIQETAEDWIIKQPLPPSSSFVKIISKDTGRLVPHPVR